MKLSRSFLPILGVLCLISGCVGGKDAHSLANEIKEHYNALPEEPLTAAVVADYGDRLAEFTLRLEGDTVTILSPEEVAGVGARLSDDGLSLIWEGAEVFTGAVTRSGLSPVAALPLMRETFRDGVVSDAWLDGGRLTVDYYISDGVSLRAEFDPETLSPLSALLTEDGGRALSAEFLEGA